MNVVKKIINSISTMPNFNELFVNKIVESCIKTYKGLPKSGKPLEDEWTVLSCVVQYNIETNEHEVVSLGTGSKCIGASKMVPTGNILNDSHAEVFARRGFLIYIYENIINLLDQKPSIFIKEGEKFKLKGNIEFIFYSSQMPCGDASIIPMKGEEDDFGNLILNKRGATDDNCDIECKKQKKDIYRTGAKCLPHTQQDPKGSGENYHTVGKVRTKPGRGDRTLSVSCSDKIARWIHLGIQGSLLDMLLYEPLTIKHFIFGAGVPYSVETLNRAFLFRDSCLSIEERLKEIPKFYKSSIKFIHSRGPVNIRPAPGSIVWVNTTDRLMEVAVHGIKLGVTKKKANSANSSLCISKYNLYKKFHEVILKSTELQTSICSSESLSNIPYNEMKKKSVKYQTQWSKIKEDFFKTWTVKPDMWNFTINNVNK